MIDLLEFHRVIDIEVDGEPREFENEERNCFIVIPKLIQPVTSRDGVSLKRAELSLVGVNFAHEGIWPSYRRVCVGFDNYIQDL